MADGHVPARPPRRPRTSKATRRNGLHWTAAERADLARRWGAMEGRRLRERFGRTAGALLSEARKLGLPSQPEARGGVSANEACRTLNVNHPTLYALLRECGLGDRAASPLRASEGAFQARSVDVAAAGDLFAVRDARTLTLGAWCSREGRCRQHDRKRLERSGLLARAGSKFQRYPVALLEAALGSLGPRGRPSGPWVDLWRAAVDVARPPYATWCLALAAWDLASARAPAWVDHLPGVVVRRARALARLLPDTAKGHTHA